MKNIRNFLIAIILFLLVGFCIKTRSEHTVSYNKYAENYEHTLTNANIINLINKNEEHKYKLKDNRLDIADSFKKGTTTYSNGIRNISLKNNDKIIPKYDTKKLEIIIDIKKSTFSSISKEIFTIAQCFPSKEVEDFILGNYNKINEGKYTGYTKTKTNMLTSCSIVRDNNLLKINWEVKSIIEERNFLLYGSIGVALIILAYFLFD